MSENFSISSAQAVRIEKLNLIQSVKESGAGRVCRLGKEQFFLV